MVSANTYFELFFIFILGSCIASFLQMYLDTGGENILRKNSKCDGCGRVLTWYELIPVVSWLGNFVLHKGKNKGCRQVLSWKYLFGEFILGLWYVGSYIYFGINLEFILCLVLGSIFFMLVMQDIDGMQVSSRTLYCFVAFSIFSVLMKSYFALGPLIKGPGVAVGDVMWVLIIFSPFWLIYFLGKYLDKHMIGEADPYVFTALGLFFGTQFSISLFLYSVWLGAGLGIGYLYFINKKFERNVRLPFLPVIFLACLIILVFNYHVIKLQDILILNEMLF